MEWLCSMRLYVCPCFNGLRWEERECSHSGDGHGCRLDLERQGMPDPIWNSTRGASSESVIDDGFLVETRMFKLRQVGQLLVGLPGARLEIRHLLMMLVEEPSNSAIASHRQAR